MFSDSGEKTNVIENINIKYKNERKWLVNNTECFVATTLCGLF